MATVDVLNEHKFNITLKPEQERVLDALVEGRDVFGVLPTGFGKSMAYILAPLLMDKVCCELDPSHFALARSISKYGHYGLIWKHVFSRDKQCLKMAESGCKNRLCYVKIRIRSSV